MRKEEIVSGRTKGNERTESCAEKQEKALLRGKAEEARDLIFPCWNAILKNEFKRKR